MRENLINNKENVTKTNKAKKTAGNSDPKFDGDIEEVKNLKMTRSVTINSGKQSKLINQLI